jgi:hypothetical protein
LTDKEKADYDKEHLPTPLQTSSSPTRPILLYQTLAKPTSMAPALAPCQYERQVFFSLSWHGRKKLFKKWPSRFIRKGCH